MTQGDLVFLYSDAAVDRCGQKDGPKHLEPLAAQFDYFQATFETVHLPSPVNDEHAETQQQCHLKHIDSVSNQRKC